MKKQAKTVLSSILCAAMLLQVGTVLPVAAYADDSELSF